MKGLPSLCIAAIILTLSQAGLEAKAPIHPAFLGEFEGGGRACSGTLKLTPRSFSWKASFMHIRNAPYEVIEQVQEGTHIKLVLKIKKQTPSWPLPVIVMECNQGQEPQVWDMAAYKSIDAYRSDNHDNLACGMFKR